MRISRGFALAAVGVTALAGAGLTAGPALASSHAPPTFLGHLHFTKKIASTVPGNGDANPYGGQSVGQSQGKLHRGNILVSNFNKTPANEQGTGSTIVQITPRGRVSLFAQISSRGLPGICPGGIGLSTALVIINGWVIVGSTPSLNGDPATAKAGCLLVLDSQGRVRETFFGHGINGPWDATAVSQGSTASLFVTNVLTGTVPANGNVVNQGTVLRIALRFFSDPNHLPQMTGFTVVGSGFAEKTDPDAFVIGPTGVGVNRSGQLYVADREQPDHGHPKRSDQGNFERHRHRRGRQAVAERAAGPSRRTERQHHHRQRRGRPGRGDHSVRHPGREQVPRHVGQSARCRGAVRPRAYPERAQPVLRGRREEHPAAALLS